MVNDINIWQYFQVAVTKTKTIDSHVSLHESNFLENMGFFIRDSLEKLWGFKNLGFLLIFRMKKLTGNLNISSKRVAGVFSLFGLIRIMTWFSSEHEYNSFSNRTFPMNPEAPVMKTVFPL